VTLYQPFLRLCLLVFSWSCGIFLPHACQAEPVTPRGEPIIPFNGTDLTGWSKWLKETGHQDPDSVFRTENETVHVTGTDFGYLATRDEYQDYHLSLEYKWGQRTDGSKFVRNSGVLLHAVGADGSREGVWMTSIECQLAQGCEGDLIVIRGTDKQGVTVPASITSDTIVAADDRTRWKEGGTKTEYSGKQFWWSQHQAGFEELLDTRGKNDVASPLGEWTRVECICRKNRITIKINGVTVNQCYNVRPAAGKILVQSEGNEVFFRNIEIRPLGDEVE
jgi:hypothetical protein